MSTSATPSPPPTRHLAARAVTAMGAVASVALQLYAGRQSPERLVVWLVAGWVLAPFVVLMLLSVRAARWPSATQRALHYVMALTGVISPSIYALALVRPVASRPPAFLFVAVPPTSLLVAALVLLATWLLSRMGGRRRVAG